ncbi:TetR/AcrR family transcriptional regulator [Veillonella criceti]|uniref:Bacterial regulatory proteins, tetR family n=1 Tax=Veillonella criceti TaxID=103891 RepID=A0A380NK66_9FIRM|nr:TetR/AcrR family transcriptional regulator [Veillonella criceti]SUP41755.1 Bacterial regulatory proteins, tetR family [Veillonella criceti]
MARSSNKIVSQRPEEIMDACEILYRTKSFNEVNLKDIGEITSISRSSIYNYFKTKEEIFLSLLTREYKVWVVELREINEQPSLLADTYVKKLAKSLSNHELLLRIQCTNLYEIEEHSRLEFLVAFKDVFKEAMICIDAGLAKFFPELTDEKRADFGYAFFPFIYGVYPYVNPSTKQKLAMDTANIHYRTISVEQIIYASIYPLLVGLLKT